MASRALLDQYVDKLLSADVLALIEAQAEEIARLKARVIILEAHSGKVARDLIRGRGIRKLGRPKKDLPIQGIETPIIAE